jgi:RNA polymerase sigma-70 factor (ECF subfamily)
MNQEGLWVAQALQGDQNAFAHLVDTFKTPVYNLCYRMLGTPAEAEDAAQETFVRVYTHLRSYDPQQKLSSWVLSVASHYCVDRLRRRRITWISLDEDPEWEPVAINAVHPEDVVLENESSKEIHKWLQTLPAEYRLVITLRYWQDLSYEEIARTTGTTESAVKSRLHRARAMLAQQVVTQHKLEEQSLPSHSALEKKVMNHAML